VKTGESINNGLYTVSSGEPAVGLQSIKASKEDFKKIVAFHGYEVLGSSFNESVGVWLLKNPNYSANK